MAAVFAGNLPATNLVLDVGEHEDAPAQERLAGLIHDGRGREHAMRVDELEGGEAEAANAVEKALSSSLKDKSLQATAWTTIGRCGPAFPRWSSPRARPPST